MARRKSTPVEDNTPDSFESPESATIASATYDAATETVTIYFRHGAGYDGSLPPAVWKSWTQATSKGSFFSHCIRPLYSLKRRTDASPS